MEAEKTIHQTSPSQIVNLKYFLLSGLLAAGVIVLSFVLENPVLLVLLLVPAVYAWWKWLLVRSMKLTLTDQRIIVSQGVFNKVTNETELYRVRVQREAIPKAIALIDEQLQSAARKRAELNLERRGNEIRELQRQTVLAICALQRLNRDRDRVVREVREGVPLEILGDFLAIKIGGYGHGGDAPGFRAYLDLMVQIGVVTRGEIEKARGDTKELH